MARGITKTQLDEMRRLYCRSPLSLIAIAQKLGVSRGTVQRHVKARQWQRQAPLAQALTRNMRPKTKIGLATSSPSSEMKRNNKCMGLAQCSERPELVGRVWAAALSQITELEKRSASLREKGRKTIVRSSDDARAIAILVRTLKDLIALDVTLEGGVREKKQDVAPAATDGKAWSTLAEDLARRLAGLRKRRTLTGPSVRDG